MTWLRATVLVVVVAAAVAVAVTLAAAFIRSAYAPAVDPTPSSSLGGLLVKTGPPTHATTVMPFETEVQS